MKRAGYIKFHQSKQNPESRCKKAAKKRKEKKKRWTQNKLAKMSVYIYQ